MGFYTGDTNGYEKWKPHVLDKSITTHSTLTRKGPLSTGVLYARHFCRYGATNNMAVLHIKSWSRERAWAGDGSWPLQAYCERIRMCTNLEGTELKRTARLIMKKELNLLEISNKEKAEALRHILESSGAEIEII